MPRSFRVLEEEGEGLDRGVDRRELLGREPLELAGQPGRAAPLDGAQDTLSSGADRQTLAASVGRVGAPLDEPRALQPIDSARYGRRRDSFECGQAADSDARLPLDLHEQRHLAARDPERVDLAPQFTDELQQYRPQPVCDLNVISRTRRFHSLTMLTKLVRMVNDFYCVQPDIGSVTAAE
jgi:hypothetical protein